MYYLMICFLTFMVWAKSAMKIITYRETEILVIMLSLIRAALLHLWEFKGSYEIVCYIFHILCGLYGGAVVRWCVWFALVQCPNFSSIWMQCFGFLRKWSLIWSLNYWIAFCVCATEIIWGKLPTFPTDFRVVSTLNKTLDHIRIMEDLQWYVVMLSCLITYYINGNKLWWKE